MVSNIRKLLISFVLTIVCFSQGTFTLEDPNLLYRSSGSQTAKALKANHSQTYEEQQSQVLAAAGPITSRITMLKLAGCVYFLASAPMVAALESINLGTQYQVTTTTPGAVQSNIAATSTNGTAFGVWLDQYYNVVGCTLTADAPGSIFNISSVPTISSAIPGVACSLNNPLCIAAWACGTNICVRPFNPSTGALSAITNANTITSTNIGGGACTRFSDDTLGVAWSSSSAGNYQVWQQTYSGSTGLSLTSPLVVNLSPTVAQGTNCIVGLPTVPNTALMGWQGGAGANWNIYKAVINTVSGTIVSPAQMISTNTSQQQGINCFTSGGEGRLAWLRNPNEIHVQPVANNGTLIGTDYILQDVTQTAQAGNPVGLDTPDGNALIIVSQNPNGYSTNYVGVFASDAAGTPQSSFVEIPFKPSGNGQSASSVALLGGNSTNYTVLSLFYGTDNTANYYMRARSINVVKSPPTNSPTVAPTIAPTFAPTGIPTSITNAPTLTPTGIPTSSSMTGAPTLAPTRTPNTNSAPTAISTPTPSTPTGTTVTSGGNALRPPFFYTVPAELISVSYRGFKGFWSYAWS